MPTLPKVSPAFFHSISVFWNFMIYQYIIRYSPWNVKPPVAHFSRISPIRAAFFRPFFRVLLNIMCNKFARLYKTNHLSNFRYDPAGRMAAAQKFFNVYIFSLLRSDFGLGGVPARLAKRYKFGIHATNAFSKICRMRVMPRGGVREGGEASHGC